MKLIVCVDDSFGILFNNRRLSRDSVVIDKISEITEKSKLWVSEYSSELFSKGNICIDNKLYSKADADDYCFVEDLFNPKFLKSATELIIFKWNRKYPSDVKFPFESLAEKFSLTDSFEFIGNSHPKITMGVYSKCSKE